MQGCEEANVKKRLIIVFAVIAAVLLLIPVRKVYEDGGTQTYTCRSAEYTEGRETGGNVKIDFVGKGYTTIGYSLLSCSHYRKK